MGFRAVFGALCALFLSSNANRLQAAESCNLQRVAELHADTSRGVLLITIQIDGHDAKVIMDTGSPVNMISPQLAAQLNLPKSSIEGGRVIDKSGHSMRNIVNVHKLGLGGMTAENIPFLVLGEAGGIAPGYDGVFGANFLEAYDVELDLAHDKVNLFMPNKCSVDPVYWTRDYDVVPFRVDASMHTVLRVTLDGEPLTAALDTGASLTTLSQLTARRTFNVDPETSGAVPDGQFSGGTGTPMPFYRHKFSDFEIGGAAFHNTELAIVAEKTNHSIADRRYGDHTDSEVNMATQVLVGLHHLVRLRAYLAFHDNKLYVSAADAN